MESDDYCLDIFLALDGSIFSADSPPDLKSYDAETFSPNYLLCILEELSVSLDEL
jgi:hypothetical protein